MSVTRLIRSESIEATAVLTVGLAAALLYACALYAAQFMVLAGLYAFVAVRLANRLGMLDARSIFFASAAIYSTAGSVDYYFFDDFGLFGEEANARVLAMASAFMTVSGAYLLGTARPSDDAVMAIDGVGKRLVYVGFAAVFMFVLYFVLSVRNFGFSIGEIDRATLTSEQSTSAALARGFGVACILVWVWLAGHSRLRMAGWLPIALTVVALTAFDLLYFGDRRIVLCMLLGIAYLTLNRRRALLWLMPLMGGLVFALLIFAAVRGQPLDEWLEILSGLELFAYLTPVNLDFGGFPLVATDLLSSSAPIVSQAPTYIDSVAATVPSALYPNRPEAFSGWYVRTFYADIAAIGGGLASNWVVESFVNLGAAGPALAGFATAALLNRICSPSSHWSRMNNAASIPAFAFVMRYDLTSFLQIFVLITLVAIITAKYAAGPVLTRRRGERQVGMRGAAECAVS